MVLYFQKFLPKLTIDAFGNIAKANIEDFVFGFHMSQARKGGNSIEIFEEVTVIMVKRLGNLKTPSNGNIATQGLA